MLLKMCACVCQMQQVRLTQLTAVQIMTHVNSTDSISDYGSLIAPHLVLGCNPDIRHNCRNADKQDASTTMLVESSLHSSCFVMFEHVKVFLTKCLLEMITLLPN